MERKENNNNKYIMKKKVSKEASVEEA